MWRSLVISAPVCHHLHSKKVPKYRRQVGQIQIFAGITSIKKQTIGVTTFPLSFPDERSHVAVLVVVGQHLPRKFRLGENTNLS